MNRKKGYGKVWYLFHCLAVKMEKKQKRFGEISVFIHPLKNFCPKLGGKE